MPIDATIEQLRGKVADTRASAMSEVERVRVNIMGQRKLLGNGIGGMKLLGGNQGILQDAPAAMEKIRARVQQRTAALTGMKPLDRIRAGVAPTVTPDSPLTLDGRQLPPAAPQKREPVIGGRSDGGGKLNVRPVIGGT